jgi:hypothetical protein
MVAAMIVMVEDRCFQARQHQEFRARRAKCERDALHCFGDAIVC